MWSKIYLIEKYEISKQSWWQHNQVVLNCQGKRRENYWELHSCYTNSMAQFINILLAKCINTRILVDRLNSNPSKSVKLQFKSDVIACIFITTTNRNASIIKEFENTPIWWKESSDWLSDQSVHAQYWTRRLKVNKSTQLQDIKEILKIK